MVNDMCPCCRKGKLIKLSNEEAWCPKCGKKNDNRNDSR